MEHLSGGLRQKCIFMACRRVFCQLIFVDGRQQTHIYEMYETEIEYHFSAKHWFLAGLRPLFFLLFYCNLMRVWHKYNKVTCWRQHVEHEEGIEVASHFSVSDTFVLVMVLIIAVPLPLLLCRFVVSFIFWWKIILAAATIINDSIQFWMLFQVVFLRAAAAWSHCSASVSTRFSSYFTASVSDYGTMWSKYFNNVLFSLQAVQ